MSYKTIFYLLLAILSFTIGISCAYSEMMTKERKVYCAPRIRSIRQSRPIIFFIADDSPKDFINDCLVRRKSIGISITLLEYDVLYTNIYERNENVLQHEDIYPEFSIVIPHLDDDLVTRPIHLFTQTPYHVIVMFIITTNNELYACDKKGVFKEDTFKDIEVFLNLLWQKYKMFHIMAEFPFVCPGYYIIFQGKKPPPPGSNLYDRTIVSISSRRSRTVLKKIVASRATLTEDYPVRANLFTRFPTAVPNCTNIHSYLKIKKAKFLKGYCGMDALVMHDIILNFNFNMEFITIKNKDDYGHVNRSTGCATGSLGYLLNNVIDISFNSRFMLSYLNTYDIQFVNYISSDSVCAVVKRPAQVPIWHYAFNLFKPYIWSAILFSFALTGVVAKVLSKIRKTFLGNHTDTYKVYSFLLLGLFGTNFSKKVQFSVLAGMCMLVSLNLLALYQGNVNLMYTSLLKYSQINTLAELSASNIPIYTSTSMLDMLGAPNSSQFIAQPIELRDIINNDDNTGTIHRKTDVTLEIILNYMDPNGRPMLDIVKECYANLFLSYMARKDFPFISEIKIYTMHLIEAGLPEAYYRLTQNSLRLFGPPAKMTKIKTEPRPFEPSTIDEFIVAICILFGGYVMSTILLIVEIRWARRMKLRKAVTPQTAIARNTDTRIFGGAQRRMQSRSLGFQE